ncbi:MAG: helix-turn-helix transcriptional regulator [Clostridia bacterium]|nr:helix-turn-helix transcriptional regulator [Clostridia bacterium]
MTIGEKIKELRQAKFMTQADLAGRQITRNMLSAIENGSAQPSLGTLLYLSERLGVPAGFLLAEEGDETLYRKMNALSNIKRAYDAGDFSICRSLCMGAASSPDDELLLLLAESDLELAKEAFDEGQLRRACRLFDEALEYAEQGRYPVDRVKAEASVYFAYLERISPSLYSEILDAGETTEFLWNAPFSAYVDLLQVIEEGRTLEAEARLALFEEGFYRTHASILLQMQAGDFAAAKSALLSLLESGELKLPVERYEVLSALETCCKEEEDYKGAYEYATEKVLLAEQLLSDIPAQKI